MFICRYLHLFLNTDFNIAVIVYLIRLIGWLSMAKGSNVADGFSLFFFFPLE